MRFFSYSHLLILLCAFATPHATEAQKKIRQRYEYDAVYDPRTKKTRRELYRIFNYKKQGQLTQITTFGRMQMQHDTVLVSIPGAKDTFQIVDNYKVDKKKPGRIEKFNRVNDTLIRANGYEVWNKNDTLRFVNLYTRISSFGFAVSSTQEKPIPLSKTNYYCDTDFSVLPLEAENVFFFDDQKRLVRKEEANTVDNKKNKRTVYYFYDAEGKILTDSCVENGICIARTLYRYDKKGKLLRSEKTLQRSVFVTDFFYNAHGDLIKKKQASDAMIIYTYVYY